ncbi:MAG: DMT family transporter [Lautropia sp.]
MTLTETNHRAILCVCGAMAAFVVNDALVKYASQTMPAAQLIFVRGMLATLLIFMVAAASGALARRRALRQPLVAWRAVLDAVATMLYLTSLFHLPIANATAINMASPLVITLLAAVLLKEYVGAARWLAVAGGFIGVLLIIQPASDAFNVYALICLAGTLMHSARDLVTRRIPPEVPSLLVTLATSIAVTVLSGVLTSIEGWQPFGRFEFTLLALASVLLAIGYHLLIIGMRIGELSLAAPFRYSGLLFAILIGYFVWGDWPNLLAWLGIILLVVAGLQVIAAERWRPGRAARAAVVESRKR